ncbi:hypothetical protein BCR43DRAFT_496277 [Syncephalastrum racemosum]|uniref:Uncharacterized protein n=1 Tax=Syncephalastrum racemosum TaxID=13706 RepID=A0A1X2H501_SYNRA|nr:hypothetical protein BCR43DRAFT_496277 [Syncephalastrum racemosum]
MTTTLEKVWPKTNGASDVAPQTQTSPRLSSPPAIDDIVEQHDFIMEQLMLEPVDYDDLPATLSAHAVKSLCMIETECLCTLADIFHALAADHRPQNNSHVPYTPHSSDDDVLGTITRSMDQLVCAIMPPHRRNANNNNLPVSSKLDFDQLRQFVDSESFWAFANNNAQYYPELCSELVHLIIATRAISRQPHAKNSAIHTHSTFGQTRRTLALLQHSLQDQLTQVDGAQYKELLRRLESVDRLLHESEASEEQPPAYEDIYAAAAGAEPTTLSSPLSLSSPSSSASSATTAAAAAGKRATGHTSDEKEELDLERILRAVDRLAVPRLCNDQRVLLNERQSKQLVAATLTTAVERLCRGRLDNQRATLRPSLCSLASCVFRSASRSLDDQRVELDARLQAKLDCAATVKLLNRMDRGRLTDQVRDLPVERPFCNFLIHSAEGTLFFLSLFTPYLLPRPHYIYIYINDPLSFSFIYFSLSSRSLRISCLPGESKK